uniref:Uncharacterized protein n=1 Tax=Zea mays TaxID=4577 RepID=A0A804NU66_MAIZE
MHTQPLIERGEEQKQTTTVLNPFIQSGDGVVNKLGVVLVRDLLVGAANEDVAVDEREGDDDLEHDAFQLADARDGVRRDGLAVGDEPEEQARHGGAQQLGHPVEDARQDGDVAAHGQPERHGRVQVAARDVRRDGHAHEQRQRVRDRDRHQARRVQRAAIRQLPCMCVEHGQGIIIDYCSGSACIEARKVKGFTYVVRAC